MSDIEHLSYAPSRGEVVPLHLKFNGETHTRTFGFETDMPHVSFIEQQQGTQRILPENYGGGAFLTIPQKQQPAAANDGQSVAADLRTPAEA